MYNFIYIYIYIYIYRERERERERQTLGGEVSGDGAERDGEHSLELHRHVRLQHAHISI